MAGAIAQGLNGKYTMEICGRDRKKALDFIAELGLQNATAPESNPIESISNPHAIHVQDKILLLCVKPYALANFSYIGQAKSVYSVLAGVSIEQIATHICATSYVRLMPNIAALHRLSATTAFCSVGGAGMINVQDRQTNQMAQQMAQKEEQESDQAMGENKDSTQAKHAKQSQQAICNKRSCVDSLARQSTMQAESLSQQIAQLKHQAREICCGFGEIVFVENEKLIDSSIATSGSAPAFLALVAQALVDSGVMVGLSRADSRTLVAQTFAGVGELLRHYSPQDLIDRVTTPGGTTIEGLAVLESSGVRGAFMQAARASVAKARAASAPVYPCFPTQPQAPAMQEPTSSQKPISTKSTKP